VSQGSINLALWILQGSLAATFVGVGVTKLIKPKAELESKMGWVKDFGASQVKSIGGLEVVAGIGLVLPPLFDVAPAISAWAALGLTILMLCAALTHLRRKEALMMIPTLILATFAFVAAWGRFGPYPF
jgi:hypothetical protein